MRMIISLVLLAGILGLSFVLFSNIQDPIKFRDEKNARKDVVVDKLKQIRTCQETYRTITGEYAHNFDTLVWVLKNDSIPFVSIEGDPDSGEEFTKTVTYSMAIDSINSWGINLDDLAIVPFSDKTFNISADTITYQQTLVHVTEVSTRWKEFMGEYANPKYSKYDNLYDPNKKLKFGDMSKPSLSGNWEL